MGTEVIASLEQVRRLQVEPDRRFYSARHEEIASGATTDVYFVRTYEILKELGKIDTVVTAEIFPRRPGIICGVNEVLALLQDRKVTIYGLPEGSPFAPKEVVMRIQGPYSEFGLFETTLLGMLASSSGWATAAREIREAAADHPFVCFGARHVHPAVAPVMERAAIVGGADGASCILAAKLAGRDPQGTVPHAVFLIIGDTVEGALAYDRLMPPDAKRTILIDTFKDEAEEALRVAEALGPALAGVRLDTPSERGGVTPELVREVRYRLDKAGYHHVGIFVSGGLTPERIRTLIEAGADAFGVGSYISGAAPIDMTMDIKEVDGRPVAKRGRLPGVVANPRLVQLK
ncbi:nicotinate phosphoribosyltransferase [Moorella sp. Hama-1]|uniref:nicotinate phosphoribosyltransferase n=1 Tax=Moorella sp. Hama-1 TaxID=2138101 RepID=UPI000D64890B|nr:nicotinate phosphoribosyltransferase [Moorella sp. Hama-1]BCV22125.1 nicotinate phosphoribosyltransferase [Moorella sp. Hama-1]